MPQLSKYIDLVSAQITATTTDVLTVEVDSEGCEGVLFLTLGTSAKATLAVTHAASTTASYATVAVGSSATHGTTAAKAVAAYDIHKPAKRHLKCTSTSTGNSYFALLAFKYGLRKLPVADWSSTTCLASTCVVADVSPTST